MKKVREIYCYKCWITLQVIHIFQQHKHIFSASGLNNNEIESYKFYFLAWMGMMIKVGYWMFHEFQPFPLAFVGYEA